jgi:hypothetical protein
MSVTPGSTVCGQEKQVRFWPISGRAIKPGRFHLRPSR